jgi:hypothetical protein
MPRFALGFSTLAGIGACATAIVLVTNGHQVAWLRSHRGSGTMTAGMKLPCDECARLRADNRADFATIVLRFPWSAQRSASPTYE